MTELYGFQVVEDPNLTEDGTPYVVQRTWRERLFSRPWHPLTATKTVIPRVPYLGAIHLGGNLLAMHPQTLAILRRKFRPVEVYGEPRLQRAWDVINEFNKVQRKKESPMS